MNKENEVKENDLQLYRALAENMAVGIVLVCASSGEIIYANSAQERMLGYGSGEMMGKSFSTVHARNEKPPEEVTQEIVQSLKTHGIWQGRVQSIKKEGDLFWGLVDISTFKHPEYGEVWAVTQQDINEKIKIEEVLHKSEERYRAIADYTFDWECWEMPNGNLAYCSPSCKRITGYEVDEFLNNPLLLTQIVHPDDTETWHEHHVEMMSSNKECMLDYRIVTREGQVRWIGHCCMPVYSQMGIFLGRRASNRDITESKLVEEQLRESEERYRRLVEGAPDIVYTFSSKRGGIYYSPRVEQILGYSEEYLYAHPMLWNESIHPDDRPRITEVIDAFESGNPFDIEYRIKNAQGNWVWLRDRSIGRHVNDDEILIEGLATDITEHKRAEDGLRESESLYRKMIENSPLGMHFYKLNGDAQLIFTGANPIADKLLGVENSQFIGKTIESAFPPLTQTEVPGHYREVAERGSPWSIEQITYDDNRIVGAFDVSAFQTIPGSMVAVFADVTERKRAEDNLRRREQEFKTLVEHTPDVIVRFDQQYRHIYVNPIVEKEFGSPPSALLGKTHRELGQSPEMANWSEGLIRQVFETKEEVDFELTIPSPEGNKYYLSHGVPEFAEDGSVTSVLFIHRNITERKKAEDLLREAEAKYRDIFENANEGIFQSTPDGRFLSVNAAMARIFGYETPEEMIASVGNDIATRIYAHPDQRASFIYRLNDNGIVEAFEMENLRKDGSIIWTRTSARVIRDADGAILYYEGFLEDVTKRKQAEERYRDIFENATEGIFQSTPDGRFVTVNAAMAHIFGYDSPEDMIASIGNNIPTRFYLHSGDRDEFVFALEQIGAIRDFEAQTLHKDGSAFWVRITARAIRDADHVVQYYEGFLEDITERKRTEDALKESEARAHAMLRAVPDLIFRMDHQGVFLDYKADIKDLYVQSEETIIGRRNRDLTPPEFADLIDQQIVLALKTGALQTFEYQLTVPGRGLREYEARMMASGADEVTSIVRDVTDRKLAEEKIKNTNRLLEEQLREIKSLQDFLREQATHDAVTGLHNRYYLYETMERELARSKREGYPISVLMIDIDHFKDLNDTFGHQAGDAVLVALGNLLRQNIRQGDVACRYGGEEFIIVMPGVNNGDTERRANAIRKDFNNLRINYGGADLSATVSIGIAYYPYHDNSMNGIIKAADAAMYQAKQAGRNCVRVWKKDS